MIHGHTTFSIRVLYSGQSKIPTIPVGFTMKPYALRVAVVEMSSNLQVSKSMLIVVRLANRNYGGGHSVARTNC